MPKIRIHKASTIEALSLSWRCLQRSQVRNELTVEKIVRNRSLEGKNAYFVTLTLTAHSPEPLYRSLPVPLQVL